MALHLLDHPLGRHYVTRLRDETTRPEAFRVYCHRLTGLLLAEATRELPTRRVRVHTPLEETEGEELSTDVVAVAVLRAGLGMLEAFTRQLPDVSIGYIGLERDEETAEARSYYCKLPPVENRPVFVVDPMLATGGSAVRAVERVRGAGATAIRFLCIVAAPEGVAAFEEAFPDIPVHAAALDRELDPRKFIRPGLGDFGDRLYGTQISDACINS
ncbi:MAG: uracil phosphoribosyltransferase [Opitutales bacterium]|nr:uracil phosphoribosyltransferase [Opitutales bacterium]